MQDKSPYNTWAPEAVAKAFLNARVRGENGSQYVAAGANMKVSGYQIRNASGNVVSATVIFRSRGGGDINETLRFIVKDIGIVSVD